jgi:hypothetical protein
MPLPAWAFLRKTGSGSHQRYQRAESVQYTNRDPNVERVRAYRRRHPEPPEPRHRGKVSVRAYYRRRAFGIWRSREEREHQAAWTAYLADYYKISRAAARKLERDSRP